MNEEDLRQVAEWAKAYLGGVWGSDEERIMDDFEDSIPLIARLLKEKE